MCLLLICIVFYQGGDLNHSVLPGENLTSNILVAKYLMISRSLLCWMLTRNGPYMFINVFVDVKTTFWYMHTGGRMDWLTAWYHSIWREHFIAGNSTTLLARLVKFPIFLPNFNQILIFSTDLHIIPNHQISRKCVSWERRWYVRVDD